MENRSRVTLYKDYRGKIASIQEFSFVADESKFRHEARTPKSSKQEELEALMSKKEEKEARAKAKAQRKAGSTHKMRQALPQHRKVEREWRMDKKQTIHKHSSCQCW